MNIARLFILLSLLAATVASAAAPADRPNIVVILADDLGYGDPHCYNPGRGRIATPAIDRLAREGMRFTDGHASSAACSPSRYTLLTGRYHWRTRLQSGIVDMWERPLIAPERLTFAGLAKRHGYHTAAIGKWHLGWDWPIKAEEMKLFRGLGGRPGRSKEPLVTVPTTVHQQAWAKTFAQGIAGGPTTRGFDEYFGTDVPNWPPYCFIKDDRTAGIPTGLLKAEQLAGFNASFQGPALEGWRLDHVLGAIGERAVNHVRERAKTGTPFLLYLPLTAPHTPIAPSEEWKGRSGLNDYADLVMETDHVIGRVLAALDETGTAKNTFLFFSSDNGYETAIGIKPLEAMGHFPSGPLRGYKRDVWEGGHREPFIVRWPGVVAPGTVCDQLVHQADLIATLAELLGTRLPDDAGEDSYSLLPLLRGGHTPVRQHAISCAANGLQSVRDGPWKLVCSATPTLFNLAKDIGEKNDLASRHPERVAAMLALRERLITEGRSTPGPRRKNDVPVRRVGG
ncbi:MAG: arylsulfatase [Opitutaceae bacterium]|nr:arylsulfatase [Opitutaceae bacterium]